ncbi:hypothetical protein [Agrobacterium tumefaciens]|uniref:hypothetical protein n=1 Tax=Agrobacterium tumefaciens TaxID=358 RepID=UPI001FAACAF5|nr:hypothetical protein [Agrobacterium tumefaciens]UNZ50401.1 hypothetical protein MLE07_13725 [Agrobacterium tumefaciens]
MNISKPPDQTNPPNVGDLRSHDVSGGVKKVEGDPKPNGSSIKIAYKHRAICYYPVTEDELDQITTFNRISGVAFAVGSFLLGLTVDVFKDLVTTTDLDAELKAQMTTASISTGILCLVCYGLGIYFLSVKSKQINKIKTEALDDL